MSSVHLGKWKTESALPSDPDKLESWSSHRRLQGHANRYLAHANHGALLRRYASDAAGLERSVLLRCLCHVRAWVALLPDDYVVRCSDGRSPVLLLAQMLRLRGRGKLTPWLHGVLKLVVERIRTTRPERHCIQQWQELERALPRKSLVAKDQCIENVRSKASDIMRKRALLLHNESTLWLNLDMSQKCERVRQLDVRVAQLKLEMDAIKLRTIIRQLVAALSSPRASVEASSCQPFDVKRSYPLQLAADLQRSVREMLIWSLAAWRRNLGLEDEQIEHVLAHVRQVIGDFEDRHGDIASAASANHQWKSLQALTAVDRSVTADVDDISEQLPKKHRKMISRADFVRIKDRYEPSARVRKLPTVECKSSEAKILKCNNCGSTLCADWFFVHPKSKASSVLVPNNGHAACRNISNIADCQFVSEDGFKTKKDIFVDLDFCEHIKKRQECATCKGGKICPHGKRRDVCRICLQFVKHRKGSGRSFRA